MYSKLFSGELRPVYVLWLRVGEETPIGLQTWILASSEHICGRYEGVRIPTVFFGSLYFFDSLAVGKASARAVECGFALQGLLGEANLEAAFGADGIRAGIGLTVVRAVSSAESELVSEIEKTIKEAMLLSDISNLRLFVSTELFMRCRHLCIFSQHSSNRVSSVASSAYARLSAFSSANPSS